MHVRKHSAIDMADPTVLRHAHGLPLFLLVLLGTNWGLGFSLAKIGVVGGLQPLAYVFYQCLGSGIVLLIICAVRGRLPPLDWRHLRYYAVAGATNIAAPNLVAFTCVGHIPVGIVVLIVTLAPLVTYGIAQAIGLEGFRPLRAVGMLFGFVGTLLILLPRASLPAPDATAWVLLALLTPIFYGGSNVYVARMRPPGVPSLALGAAMQLAAGACLLPLALAAGAMHVLWPPFSDAEIANLSHIAVASLGSMIFFEVMRLNGPVFASQVGYIVCLSGVFWGKLFFAEQHSAWIWAAMAVILGGLALVTWPARREI